MIKMWLDALIQIETVGDPLSSRAGECMEAIGYSDTLDCANETILLHPVRNLDPAYACAEFLWYLSMTDDTTFLQRFAPSYGRFCEDGIHAFGAYGHRWKLNAQINEGESTIGQLYTALSVLKAHPESRQVVMTMWDGTDLVHAEAVDKKDLPCTLTHQFLMRHGYLHLVTTMRSNDAWLGMPYDVFCNTQLLKLFAVMLGCSTGSYTHNVGSMHYYDKNYEKIKQILDSTEEIPEAPFSVYYAVENPLPLEEQVSNSIKYIDELDECLLVGVHSPIADCARVCACKFAEFKSEQADLIDDDQLILAVKTFYNLEA